MLAKKPKGATEKRKTSSVSGLLWMFVGAVLTLMIGVFLYLSPLFNFSPAGSGEGTDADRQVQQRVDTDSDNGDYEFYDILPNQEMATIPDEDFGEGNNSQSGQITDFEPDVVVNQPENTTPSNNDAGNFGISESTTIESSRSNNANNAANSSNDDDIVIVEEDATYDGTPPAASNTGAAANRANTANASNASIQPAKPAATYILQINSFGDADEADRRRAQVLMAGVDAKVVKNTTGNGLPIYQVISRPMNNRQAVATAQQRLQNNGIDSIIVEQRR